MEREPVSSSTVAAIGYDASSETLEVEFKRGTVYQYLNVPEVIWERMMSADSIGRFFNAEIKNAYPCERL